MSSPEEKLLEPKKDLALRISEGLTTAIRVNRPFKMARLFQVASAIGQAGSKTPVFRVTVAEGLDSTFIAVALSQEISKGDAPSKITFDLTGTKIMREGLEALSHLILNTETEVDLLFGRGETNEWDDCVILFPAIKNGRGKLLLDLSQRHIDIDHLDEIAIAIRDSHLSALILDLSQTPLGYSGLSAIADAIGTRQGNGDLTLILDAITLQKAYDEEPLTLESVCEISSKFAAAIRSKQAPQNLNLTLGFSALLPDPRQENIIWSGLAKAIQSGDCPPGLEITNLDKTPGQPLIPNNKALHRSRALVVFTLLCMREREKARIPIDVIIIMSRYIMPSWWSGPRVPEQGRNYLRRILRFFPDLTTAKPASIAADPESVGEEPPLKMRKSES